MSTTTPKPPTKTQSAAAGPRPQQQIVKALKFRGPESVEWRDLRPQIPEDASEGDRKAALEGAARAKDDLKSVMLSSLQMQHVVVLAGSGTSLGGPVNGPSMWDLWDHCVNSNPGSGESVQRQLTPLATKVISDVGHTTTEMNIESLLSQCEASMQIRMHADVAKFVKESKEKILSMCSRFLKPDDAEQLNAHRTFLHRLSRRRARDSRMKVFTTNYDLCFETAAARQGIIVIDGFSFSQPREYDPRFFLYDIVRRSRSGEDATSFVEGIFLLYKLHGSVNWERTADGRVRERETPAANSACLIYPAKGKYQQSYLQPHLELMSQYFAALREPNTCLIVAGFGFNDDHLSEPILSAIQNNPHLRIIVVNKGAESGISGGANRFWTALAKASEYGNDVWFVNADFQDFADLIPDLKALTPAQKLALDIKKITEKS